MREEQERKRLEEEMRKKREQEEEDRRLAVSWLDRYMCIVWMGDVSLSYVNVSVNAGEVQTGGGGCLPTEVCLAHSSLY